MIVRGFFSLLGDGFLIGVVCSSAPWRKERFTVGSKGRADEFLFKLSGRVQYDSMRY